MERPWEPALLRAARALNAPGAGVEWVVVGSVMGVLLGIALGLHATRKDNHS